MGKESSKDIEEAALEKLWSSVQKNTDSKVRGVWEIRDSLPLVRTWNDDTGSYEPTGESPVKISLKGGGEISVGRSNDSEGQDTQKDKGLQIDLRFPSVRGDDEMINDTFNVFGKSKNGIIDDFWIFWVSLTVKSETERMKNLARFDPRKDIDLESLKTGSLEEMVAKALCKYSI